jgi:uncharacterized membrane protein YgdD (TMEM256/DUF423 family)
MAGDRRVLVRGGLLAAIAILTVGFAATQSRGGLVAAAMTLVASLVVFRGRLRLYAIAVTTVVLAAGPSGSGPSGRLGRAHVVR